MDGGLPAALRGIGIEQRLDAPLPADLEFVDESGRRVRLGDYLGERPVILALAYYTCPMLCNQVLQGLTRSLSVVDLEIGKDFEIVTVSFDPRDTPQTAAAMKRSHVQRYHGTGAEEGWHFLSGEVAAIERLTEAVGFHYEYDSETKQYAHASGIMIVNPEGRLSHYFYGIDYTPRDVRLGLVEASKNRIGSPVDQLLLYCYRYDPATGKYGAVVMNMLRVGGIVTMACLLAMMLFLRRRPQAKRLDVGGPA